MRASTRVGLTETRLGPARIAPPPAASDGVVGEVARSESLRRYIRSRAHDHHHAEDLQQEVALVLAERVRRGQDIGDAAAFARGVARRALLAHWRAARRAPVVLPPGDLDALVGTCAEQGADRREQLAHMWRTVGELPHELRTVLLERYWHDRRVKDIARSLSRTPNATAVALYRARTLLASRCLKQKQVPRRTSPPSRDLPPTSSG
jgi:RNA polymerase sigma factor (sigma-70 family)